MDGRDFLEIADKLGEASTNFERNYMPLLKRLLGVATQLHEAWSGSNLGYQANVYYAGFQKRPAGARFSIESGIEEDWLSDTAGDWQEFNRSDVIHAAYHLAGNPDMDECKTQSAGVLATFNEFKGELLSGLNIVLEGRQDTYLTSLMEQVRDVDVKSAHQLARAFLPGGQFISRDTRALTGGIQVAGHQQVIADATALNQPSECCKALAQLARQAGSHLVRIERKTRSPSLLGTSIFIGHGRSGQWRLLKDFIKDRLHLPPDEFNRVPIAGISNVTRLSEMLDSAAFALLVLTAEDEQQDGKLNARMNVIHEVGLFQGRLGFRKAIVLLEEGCEQFSNIEGLGQIRFPKDNIAASFEDVRSVLEREGVLGSMKS